MTTTEIPPRFVDEAPLDAELARVRRLTAYATVATTCISLAAGLALATISPTLPLLPVAFLLGWLNLVGL